MKKKDLQKIKDYFSKQPAVLLVYLYGSQARAEAREGSDVDLAILVDEKRGDDFKIQLQAMSDLSTKLHREVEIQNLNICKTTFAYRVISEGKIIYQRDEQKRVDFEITVMRNYFDLKPLLEEFSFYLKERARRGLLSKSIYQV